MSDVSHRPVHRPRRDLKRTKDRNPQPQGLPSNTENRTSLAKIIQPDYRGKDMLVNTVQKVLRLRKRTHQYWFPCGIELHPTHASRSQWHMLPSPLTPPPSPSFASYSSCKTQLKLSPLPCLHPTISLHFAMLRLGCWSNLLITEHLPYFCDGTHFQDSGMSCNFSRQKVGIVAILLLCQTPIYIFLLSPVSRTPYFPPPCPQTDPFPRCPQ